MKVTPLGAAKIVTGSCYLIETSKSKILVDCGMFQGTKDITRLNYKPFRFKPEEISHLLLTHAHIDHSGLIPKLTNNGFTGEILATAATIDLCKIMFEDSAHIQEADTRHENRRRLRKGLTPRKPLYTIEDAQKTFAYFREIEYEKSYHITEEIGVCFRDAGHILGSAIVEVMIKENLRNSKVIFSGDLGQWNVPIVRDPAIVDNGDYVFVESTYGNRCRENFENRDKALLQYAKETHRRGGKLMIPSFAIERTQELLYSFNKLIKEKKFPNQKIYLDSPLAIKATEIFKKHKDIFDKEARVLFKNPFTYPQLIYSETADESRKLNESKDPCIIIAGSGMCTGGRIRHHIKHGIWDPKNTILFVGYQAMGTLGRIILEGAHMVKMMGIEVIVKADIRKINGFSAHADSTELMKWCKGFNRKPKKIFIMHGEEESSEAFKSKLEKEGFECYIPIIDEQLML